MVVVRVGGGGYLIMQHGKVAKSKDSVRIREDIKVHDGCLQPKYCSMLAAAGC